jgi:hypothetical protein
MALLLTAGCATGAPTGRLTGNPLTNRRAPDRYAQSADSATSGCLRNPACYTQTSDEALIPWLSRTLDTTRAAVTVMRLLETAEMARVEVLLVECAKNANAQVNEDEFGPGNLPTSAQCNEVLRQEKGKDVTRAMELGNKKHKVTLECAQRELGKLFPDNFTLQPIYKLDRATGRWRMLEPKQVAQWIQDGLFELLLGTLAPDVVIHESGNPNKVQRVYDFKFPCLPDKKTIPEWRRYPKGHPHHPKNQGDMYQRALGGEQKPALITPQVGVQP